MTNTYLAMNEVEWSYLRRDGAKYLCRWCNQAYHLFCANPACQAYGNRPALVRTHTLPKALIDGVKAERKAKRIADNEAIVQQQVDLFAAAGRAVKAFKATTTRKQVTVEIPTVQTVTSYSFRSETDSPFYDMSLPKATYIGWQTVRVNLADGSWKNTESAAEITREQVISA